MIWLGDVQASPESMDRIYQKMFTLEHQRGVVISDRGPGVRVHPPKFEQVATAVLGPGPLLVTALLKAFGHEWDVFGVPNDLAKSHVKAMLLEAAGWDSTPFPFRIGRDDWRGTKIWRVYAGPEQEAPPEEITYRGDRICILPAEAPIPRKIGERRPRRARSLPAGARKEGGGRDGESMCV